MKKIFFLFFITTLSCSFLSLETFANKDFQPEGVQIDTLDDFPLAGDEDLLDKLVADAIDGGVLPDKPEFPPPTKAQVILAKVGFPFLNFYFFVKEKACSFRAWLIARWCALTAGKSVSDTRDGGQEAGN